MIVCFLLVSACGVKVEYLPQVSYPFVSQLDYFKEVKNVNGRARKKRFRHDIIRSPFYFLLKVNDIENDGTITVRFYSTGEQSIPERMDVDNTIKNKTDEIKTDEIKADNIKANKNIATDDKTGGKKTESQNTDGKTKIAGKKITERVFQFGKAGKYYEYVIFFDQVSELTPGNYRCAVFHNSTLIYEAGIKIEGKND